jgi:hypothetical protein
MQPGSAAHLNLRDVAKFPSNSHREGRRVPAPPGCVSGLAVRPSEMTFSYSLAATRMPARHHPAGAINVAVPGATLDRSKPGTSTLATTRMRQDTAKRLR